MRKWLNAAGLVILATGCAGDDTVSSSSAPPRAVDPPAASTCTATAELSAPLRRLTLREYERTVRDLLGLTDVPTASFPTDPIAEGFDNNAAVLNVSPLLAEKYMEAAEALANAAVANLSSLLPCDPGIVGEPACARSFAESFAQRAYRRPPTPAEIERLLRAYAAGSADASFADGISLLIQTALQAPAFLYRFELGTDPNARQGLVRLSQYELASRLSYLLWGSMPSDELFAAAAAGQLSGPDQLVLWAEKLLAEPRARPALADFYRQWLGLGPLPTITKDPELYPELDDAMRSAMAAELPAFVEHVVWGADRRLSTLLTAPVGFVSGPLAAIYGVEAMSSGGPTQVMLNPAERVGVLTLPGLLAVHALPNQSSPVARGKFVRERLLCQTPPPPPPDLNVTPPEVDASKSTRERFAEHTASAACAVCHELMDPIGFAFESYDAVGRFRALDGERPIDTSGWIAKSTDADGTFQNVRELGNKLAASSQVQSCLATQWFRYTFGRHEGPADACSLASVQQAFQASDGDLVALLLAFVRTEAFLYRSAIRPEEVAP
jgi:hypothetical protein